MVSSALQRTDVLFVLRPFAISVSISWLCLSTVEAYKYQPRQANGLQLPTSLKGNTDQLKEMQAYEADGEESADYRFYLTFCKDWVGSGPVPGQISPQFPAQVAVSPSSGSRAGGSPWKTKRNKSPQTLHAFSSTVESNVRKCLVFCSYWLVLNTQILWHFWTNPSVAWIQANFQCAAHPPPGFKIPVCGQQK